MIAELKRVLTTFRGRIARGWWWIGVAVWFIANVAGGFLINPDYFLAEEAPPPLWADTLWQLALLVPLTAVVVKRCNDRDWPSWIGYAFGASFAGYALLVQVGAPIGMQAQGTGRAVFWMLALFQLAVVVDNGFFRGTEGPNRHGPDPLTPASNSQ